MIGSNVVVSVYHLDKTTTIDTYPVIADIDGVDAFIESQSAELSQALDQQHNIETFLMYTDPIVLYPGDKIIDDQGFEYRVSAVERHEFNTDIPTDLYTTVLHRESISS